MANFHMHSSFINFAPTKWTSNTIAYTHSFVRETYQYIVGERDCGNVKMIGISYIINLLRIVIMVSHVTFEMHIVRCR